MKTTRILMLTALIAGVAHAGIQDRIEYKLNRPGRTDVRNAGAKEKGVDKKEAREAKETKKD